MCDGWKCYSPSDRRKMVWCPFFYFFKLVMYNVWGFNYRVSVSFFMLTCLTESNGFRNWRLFLPINIAIMVFELSKYHQPSSLSNQFKTYSGYYFFTLCIEGTECELLTVCLSKMLTFENFINYFWLRWRMGMVIGKLHISHDSPHFIRHGGFIQSCLL